MEDHALSTAYKDATLSFQNDYLYGACTKKSCFFHSKSKLKTNCLQ
jgi:hypothetical protein